MNTGNVSVTRLSINISTDWLAQVKNPQWLPPHKPAPAAPALWARPFPRVTRTTENSCPGIRHSRSGTDCSARHLAPRGLRPRAVCGGCAILKRIGVLVILYTPGHTLCGEGTSLELINHQLSREY